MDISLMILACRDLLAIKCPIEIRITSDKKGYTAKGHEITAAHYEARYRKNKIIKHVIFVNLYPVIQSEYVLADVIAHEICHAAQFEHNIFSHEKHHDKKFQKLCKILETELPSLGFKLGSLYNPLTDTD